MHLHERGGWPRFPWDQATLAGIWRRRATGARFWRTKSNAPLNPRRRKVLDRLLGDFEGALAPSKWAKLGKCARDASQRDITHPTDLCAVAKASPAGAPRSSDP